MSEEINENTIEYTQTVDYDNKEEHVIEMNDENKQLLNAHVLPFAGFWMRFWAYLLDLIVIGSINRMLIYPLFRGFDLPLDDSGIFSPINIITAITFYVYFVLMTKYLGQTLGKMVFGLKVIHLKESKLSWGSVIFREWIGRFISATIFVLYVLVAFMPKKQGLHDLFADTIVVHEK